LLRALPKDKRAVIDWYLATIYSAIIASAPIFKNLKTVFENFSPFQKSYYKLNRLNY